MPATHTPKFPVVDPAPSFGKAIANFNFKDVASVGIFTISGFVAGWAGARKPMRYHNSRFLAGIGLLAGTFFATQSSIQRFMGLNPNDREVAVYGVMSAEDLAEHTRRSNTPNIELIESESTRK